MADLSHDAVHKFWHEYEDPMIYRVISFMEGVEDWTLDGNPELELVRFEPHPPPPCATHEHPPDDMTNA